MGILPGTDGEVKMSKSLGNHIALLLEPADMYGKLMSIPDKAMPDFFRLVSRLTPAEIKEIEDGLAAGKLHPRDVKMRLAREIVSIYHNPEAAQEAEEAFKRVFQQGDVPDDMPEYTLLDGQSVLDVLAESKIVPSRGEGRRMVQQGGVSLDGEKLTDPHAAFPGSGVLRVGKRKFVRVIE